jgi:acetyl esterase/lipase
MLRADAARWKIDPARIGLLGFSAGGQVAAMAITRFGEPAYAARDEIDEQSYRPDFSLLVYPWNLWDAERSRLIEGVAPGPKTPPTFLVHTDDDKSSSLGSVAFYAALKEHNVPAELHVYQTGGHGYGLRPVEGSEIHTWPARAAAWLAQRLKTPGK